jgi:hypothetical protein
VSDLPPKMSHDSQLLHRRSVVGFAAGLLGSFLWYRPGLCQCRFRIPTWACIGLHRQNFSGWYRIYYRPKQLYCRPRPAAQLLTIHSLVAVRRDRAKERREDANPDYAGAEENLASLHSVSFKHPLEMKARFVTSLPTDNCPQPKETLPAVSTLTLPY